MENRLETDGDNDDIYELYVSPRYSDASGIVF